MTDMENYAAAQSSTSPNEPDLPDGNEGLPPTYDVTDVTIETHEPSDMETSVKHLAKTVDHIARKVDVICDQVSSARQQKQSNAFPLLEPLNTSSTGKPSAVASTNNGVVSNKALEDEIEGGDEDKEKGFFQEDENEERGNWSGKLDFIMACLGYAVGLGNVWRFPYLCFENGGGSFFIPYVIMLLFVGLPTFFLELSLGQFSSSGPLLAYRYAPILSGLGIGMVIASGLVSIYYNVLISWAMYYLALSFTGRLPWDGCSSEWNDYRCSMTVNDFPCNESSMTANETGVCYNGTEKIGLWNGTLAANNSIIRQTPSQQYFNYRLLDLSKSPSIDNLGGLRWELCVCLLAAWTLVCLCLIKGVKSSGKVVYFTALFPYAMLITLFINGMTLSGMGNGIKYYVTPDWNRLLDAKIWNDAAVQIMFSLGTCFGGLVTLASYNRFHTNTLRDSFIVAFGNCCTSIFAGFVIFAYLGHMAEQLGTSVSKVVDGGVGLAFVVYPQSVLTLPFPPIWSILFFIMLLTLGMGSQFAQVETVTTSITDRFPQLRTKKPLVIITVSILFFFIGLSMCTDGGVYVLTLFNDYSGSWGVLFIGILENISIAWIYGYKRFFSDIEVMTGKRPWIWWFVCWGFITPAILTFVLVFSWVDFSPMKYDGKLMPYWANIVGIILVVLVAAAPIVTAFYRTCRAPIPGSFFQKFRHMLKPKWNWGPALAKHRALITYVPGFLPDISDPAIRKMHTDESCYDLESFHTKDNKGDKSTVSFSNNAFESKE